MADERKRAIDRRQERDPVVGSRNAASESEGFARQASGA
jgi:hypothetical protein